MEVRDMKTLMKYVETLVELILVGCGAVIIGGLIVCLAPLMAIIAEQLGGASGADKQID